MISLSFVFADTIFGNVFCVLWHLERLVLSKKSSFLELFSKSL
jgi:hypothetical protein